MSHGYREPKRRPQGRWAQYLLRMREDRDWSASRAFEDLHSGLGLGPKSRASYVALEKGPRAPSPEQQDFLVRYYGKSPDDLPDIVEQAEPKDELIEALRAQTDAIHALAEAIANDRTERAEWGTGLLAGLRDLAEAARATARPGGRGRTRPAGAQQ